MPDRGAPLEQSILLGSFHIDILEVLLFVFYPFRYVFLFLGRVSCLIWNKVSCQGDIPFNPCNSVPRAAGIMKL